MSKLVERFVCFLIGGGLVWAYFAVTKTNTDTTKDNSTQRVERKKQVEERIAAGPKVSVRKTAEGELLEVLVPFKSLGGSLVETNRCMVWRDAVMKTASMVCDFEPRETRIKSSFNVTLA